ncbi:hypothetical protein FHW96_000699 [Novosphingobium sp. SG751A]|uniref:hypothetical protein n=1 Tax=Novosphingobium sp. SG751A TaxID=2587000 RepID=UPI001554266C|nr:hypothetical protein [Novosphingobium sp. SG751A]NOW44557.1 hypothetical protein [Novosphingobium sp. SG751A]
MNRLPSTDLYFRNAMAPWVRPCLGWGKRPIRAAGANAFIAGDAFVLIRQDRPKVMRMALNWRGPMVYVIDDDVAAGAVCPLLPDTYRARLAWFQQAFHRDLLARADIVLAASEVLAQRLARNRAGPIMRIDPAWRQPLADGAHFAPLARGAPLQVVQLGSGSHRGALAAIAPIMRDLLDRHQNLRFTYFSPRTIDQGLERHSRARRIEPMTWPEYQRWMARNRFHLALYPLTQTAFDRARSASKLTEHAIMGAAGLYPQGWPPAQGHEGALMAPDRPEEWGETITQCIHRRYELQWIAQSFSKSLPCVQRFAVQQEMWQRILPIEQW